MYFICETNSNHLRSSPFIARILSQNSVRIAFGQETTTYWCIRSTSCRRRRRCGGGGTT